MGSIGYAQIKFQKAESHQLVVDQCKLSRKVIFYYIESSECSKCSKIAEKGLEENEVGKLYNSTFYSIKISNKSQQFKDLVNMFPKIEHSLFAFISPDNYLVEFVTYVSNAKFFYKNLINLLHFF